jgi:Domain of unknown function (DUF1707)
MTRDFPTGELRVSDADRDRALAELSEHFQIGRLTQDEFDERSGRALLAKTGDDLRELFTDLPSREPTAGPDAEPGPAPAFPPAAAMRTRRRSPVGIIIPCAIAAIVIGNVLGNVGHGFNHASFGWIVPVVILLIVARRISRR